MEKVINIVIALVVAWVIITFLVPFLPAPFGVIATVVVVIAAIVYLMKVVGLWF